MDEEYDQEIDELGAAGLEGPEDEQAELEDGEIRMDQQMLDEMDEDMVVRYDVEEDDELADDEQDPDAASNGEGQQNEGGEKE